jgi:hypothetical protein
MNEFSVGLWAGLVERGLWTRFWHAWLDPASPGRRRQLAFHLENFRAN